jgi:PAS domain S-box-containing protein
MEKAKRGASNGASPEASDGPSPEASDGASPEASDGASPEAPDGLAEIAPGRRGIDEEWQRAIERAVIENLPNDGVIAFDRDLRYTMVRGISLTEVGLKGIEGRTVQECFPSTEVPRIEGMLRDVLRGEGGVSDHVYGGRTFRTHRVPVRGRNGEVVGGLLLAQDLTARLAAEEAQRETEARYQLIFERAGESIYMVQADGDGIGTILNANRSAAQAHGYSLDEFTGMNVLQLVRNVLPDQIRAAIRNVYATGWQQAETSHAHRDGTVFPIEVSTGPIEFHGSPCIIVFMRDVTERARSLQALLRAKEDIERANRDLESFSYSVAHDLRAPLRAIDGFSQAVLEDYCDKLDEVGVDYLRRVREASQHMAQLIDDLLMLSRITRAEVARVPVDLSRLAAQVNERLARTAPTAHPIEVVIAAGLTAHGDARLLSILLENLLGNARKFSARREGARIELGALFEGGEQVYFVRDNGAGFDMRHAAKLFGVFQRLHSTEEFEGTGVGLATVQRVVHKHGGRVWAEAQAGVGATFYFTLIEPSAGEWAVRE